MVTKNDIVVGICKETGRPHKEIRRIVQRTLDRIVDAVLKDGRIELRNFGVFLVRRRKARRGRNPKTGESVQVPARRVVVFKPGLIMQQKLG